MNIWSLSGFDVGDDRQSTCPSSHRSANGRYEFKPRRLVDRPDEKPPRKNFIAS